MSSVLLASLPFQLVCHLLVGGSPGLNDTNIATNQTECQNKPQTLPEGYIALPQFGVAYNFHNETLPWKEARKKCVLEGGQLALIDSVEKYKYLFDNRKGNSVVSVGIQWFNNEWVSISNGAALESLPWMSGEPDGDEPCVSANLALGGLTNYICNSTGHYVCELPIPSS